MTFLSHLSKKTLTISLLGLAGCQTVDLTNDPLSVLRNQSIFASSTDESDMTGETRPNKVSLKDTVEDVGSQINVDAGFAEAVAAAVKNDPKVQLAKAQILERQANLGVARSQLNFQLSGNVYAGLEDITDNTQGIAAVLRASKVLYDGGQISNTISAEEYAVQSAFESYKATRDDRALEVGKAWIELERYQTLGLLIAGRLAVLDPLIRQLEKIADAGVGDATQVAAAQRTVSLIREAETDVQERLAQAELNFVRILGKLPTKVVFDSAIVAQAVPSKITGDMALAAPGLLAEYAAYMSALRALDVVKARVGASVGFEANVQRPFGGSGYDSDESVGFVVSKTIFDGGKLASEIAAAEAMVARQEAQVKDVYRRGRAAVEASLQSISSMVKAIEMARSNAQALRDEISLLKKQLVIGQSTLDNVLSAEARLYDAESKEIQFTAEKRTSQLSLLSALGRLSSVVGIDVAGEH
jgi:outer membrane protein TolC